MASWAPVVRDLWRRVTGDGGPLHVTALDAGARRVRGGDAGQSGTARRAFEVDGSHVAATDPVSACVGLHRYLMEVCGVRVSWDTDLPLRLDAPPAAAPVRGEARVDAFYYLNFCTFSYSTAYWGWDEWERELDWMALHGVTMPLALVGHEAVLALAYSRLGMAEADVRAFLGGPGYLPFLYMGCLDTFAGPLPAGWLERRLDLGRRILARAREFGMTPVLPAFTGHVPRALAPAGSRARRWQGLDTVALRPEEPLFRELTAGIVAAQRELLGTDHRYASDPFIEMVPGETEEPAAVAAAIVDGLRAADPAATWVLQSWPFSYLRSYWSAERVAAFLAGIPRDGVMLLDLWGEADPQWDRLDGYAGRPWLWNGLLNFGGRSEPVADLASTDRNLEAALASARPPVGLGLTMEAIHNNPAFFELIADRAWHSGPTGLKSWLRDFGRHRYGSANATVDRVWDALGATVLRADSRAIFPEKFIAVAVSRPDYDRMLTTLDDDVRRALFYRPADLLDACTALLDLPPSAPVTNDLVLSCVALLLRVIDHRCAALVGAVKAAKAGPMPLRQTGPAKATAQRDGRVDPAAATAFLDAFDDLEALVRTRPAMRLSTWVEAAARWAEDPAGRRVLEDNARRILTVWNTAENPLLDNYAMRVWSGLVAYQKRRFEAWLRFLPDALDPDLRAGAQVALDGELHRLAEAFVATGPPAETAAGDPADAARLVLARYGDEFSHLGS